MIKQLLCLLAILLFRGCRGVMRAPLRRGRRRRWGRRLQSQSSIRSRRPSTSFRSTTTQNGGYDAPSGPAVMAV